MRQPAHGFRQLLTRRPFRRTQKGASALELAIVAPSLVLLIFFTIQGALYFYGRTVAIQSAREGVSQLRLAPDRTTFDDIRRQVSDNTERFAVSVGREALLDPVATATYDEAGGRVSMEVTGRVITLVPGLDLTVTSTAYGPVERFEGN